MYYEPMSAGQDQLSSTKRRTTQGEQHGAEKKKSIAAQIVDHVVARLVREDLKVGDFLGTEASICNEFGSSRFPVREALSRLEALGLVRIKRGIDGGVWIKEGDPDHFGELLAVHFLLADVSLVELFEARIAIVPKAAEFAAMHATPEQIDVLRGLLDRIEIERENFDKALGALLDFHLKLVEYSGLRTLTVLNRSLSFVLKDMHQHYPPPILTTSRAVDSYTGLKRLRAVLEKIEKRDAAAAKTLMTEAIAGHRDAVLAIAAGEPHSG
jgi:GntR family transcriptional repressor for pyruvate dehydrogenase complex